MQFLKNRGLFYLHYVNLRAKLHYADVFCPLLMRFHGQKYSKMKYFAREPFNECVKRCKFRGLYSPSWAKRNATELYAHGRSLRDLENRISFFSARCASLWSILFDRNFLSNEKRPSGLLTLRRSFLFWNGFYAFFLASSLSWLTSIRMVSFISTLSSRISRAANVSTFFWI